MIQASPEIWDEVARHYPREVATAERDLAREIAGVLNDIGLLPPARLLEVGAGSGHLSLLLHERGYDTTLLDFSPVAIEHARAMYAAHGHAGKAAAAEDGRFVQGDAFDLPRMSRGGFDLAWNSGVCEHFDAARLERMLRGMAAVASKVLVIVPNLESVFYLAGRRRATAQNSWPYGVELLRRNYVEIFRAAGLGSVGHGFLARGMTREWLRLAVGAEAAPLFEHLLDEKHMPSRELYLQYFIGHLAADAMRQSGIAASPHAKDMDDDAFDRTFSLDALGTAVAALAKTQQEAERLKADAAEAHKLRCEMESLRQHLKDPIAAIHASTSWRLTAPLRCAARALRKVRRVSRVQNGLRHVSSTGRLLLDVNGHGRRIAHLQELVRTVGLRGATSWALRRVYDGRGNSPSSPKTNTDRVPLRILRRMTPNDFFAYLEGEQARGRAVFCQLPNIGWDVPLFQRPQQIATAMSRLGALVVYFTRYDNVNGFEEISPGLWLFSHIGSFSRFSGVIASVYSTSRNKVDVLERVAKRNTLIYEYIDHIDESISGHGVPVLERNKQYCFNSADLIVVSADVLRRDALQTVGPERVCFVPNGVDYSHYIKTNDDREPTPLPLSLFIDRYQTIVGYFGALAPWIWYEMLNELTERRSDLGFVFIGPDYCGGRKNLVIRDNVLVPGVVPYKDLPGWARHFDVAIIPFRHGEIARTTSPLKLFEYFALEKPVVVTDQMRECTIYPEVFRASDGGGFSREIDRALAVSNSPEVRARLRQLALENTWDVRAEVMLKAALATQLRNGASRQPPTSAMPGFGH